jgi:hypothetical protein
MAEDLIVLVGMALEASGGIDAAEGFGSCCPKVVKP